MSAHRNRGIFNFIEIEHTAHHSRLFKLDAVKGLRLQGRTRQEEHFHRRSIDHGKLERIRNRRIKGVHAIGIRHHFNLFRHMKYAVDNSHTSHANDRFRCGSSIDTENNASHLIISFSNRIARIRHRTGSLVVTAGHQGEHCNQGKNRKFQFFHFSSSVSGGSSTFSLLSGKN